MLAANISGALKGIFQFRENKIDLSGGAFEACVVMLARAIGRDRLIIRTARL